MRIFVTPAFPSEGASPERAWLLDRCANSRRGHRAVETPADADVILLTDAGVHLSQARGARTSRVVRLLRHPCIVRHPSRCFVFSEADVPKLYLPGIFAYLEWAPRVDHMAAAVAPGRALETRANPYLVDTAPPRHRDLLFSFMGRDSHAVRRELLRTTFGRDDVILRDTTATYTHYGAFQDETIQRRYVDVIRRSRWAVCPRGWSASSLRLFEVMRLGVAPVVLCDNWLRPVGPDWEKCCLWIEERRVRELPRILEREGDAWHTMGLEAQAAYRTHFSPETIFDHYAAALELLLTSRCRGSRAAWRVRQLAELITLVLGVPSPRLVAFGRKGRSAIAHARSGTTGRALAPRS